MKATINKDTFVNEMKQHQCANHLSRAQLGKLFDVLEEMESDLGEEMEFDPIAIMCDFKVYDDFEEIINDYDDMFDDCESNDEIIERLQEHTSVYCTDEDCIIIGAF